MSNQVNQVGSNLEVMLKNGVWAVMAMAVSRDNHLALTVSADHIIGRYDLAVRRQQFSKYVYIDGNDRRVLSTMLARRALSIEPNIPATRLLLSETTVGYALSAAGTESTFALRTSCTQRRSASDHRRR
jgi:hypothetical protein